MISLAAGLSKTDLIPVVHTITPFIVERALEQIKVDFGYQKLNGNFISVGNSYDYAGLGCTHHCPGDIAILSSIPGIQLVAPGNDKEFNLYFKTLSNLT
jgi:transketolase